MKHTLVLVATSAEVKPVEHAAAGTVRVCETIFCEVITSTSPTWIVHARLRGDVEDDGGCRDRGGFPRGVRRSVRLQPLQ